MDWLNKFFDVNGAAAHIVHLIQTEGATAIDDVKQALNVIKAFTGKDYIGVFAALNKANADTQEIITAIKAEFGMQ